jgi:predicted  nucleic acid-binding Zn-ribbon protein
MIRYIVFGFIVVLLAGAGVVLARHLRNKVEQELAALERCLTAANQHFEAARLDLEQLERDCAETQRLIDRAFRRRDETPTQHSSKGAERWN